MKKIKKLVRNDRGQGLVEYALILVLIAIVVIAAIQNVGTKTCQTFSKIDSKMVVPTN